MGEKWLEIKVKESFNAGKKSKKFLDSVFLSHFSPMSIFQTTKNFKFSLCPFLTFFSTRVLETHLEVLKAACIGPALSQFRQSVGDGAT